YLVPIAAESFESGLAVSYQCYHHLSVVRCVASFHDHVIAVEHIVPDHGVPFNLQHVDLVFTQQAGRDGNCLSILFDLDERTPGNPPWPFAFSWFVSHVHCGVPQLVTKAFYHRRAFTRFVLYTSHPADIAGAP